MERPVGLILAGGLSRRMGGGDKALLALGDGTILSHIAGVLRPQVSALLLNANGPGERFGLDLPVIADTVPDRPGPLAGILAGLDHLAVSGLPARHLLTVPADCPFLPADLAVRLSAAAGREGAACATSGGRVHGVIGLWPVAARDRLRQLLVEEGQRRVDAWLARVGAIPVAWPVTPQDPFFNVNTPEDLARAQALIAAQAG